MLCQCLPPSVVCHRPGLNSQPTLAFMNRTVLTAFFGGVWNGWVRGTLGAGTAVQVFPPFTVFSSSAGQGAGLSVRLHLRAPSTNPVCADTKLADCTSNFFGGGGLPLAGRADALPAPAARRSRGTAA